MNPISQSIGKSSEPDGPHCSVRPDCIGRGRRISCCNFAYFVECRQRENIDSLNVLSKCSDAFPDLSRFAVKPRMHTPGHACFPYPFSVHRHPKRGVAYRDG